MVNQPIRFVPGDRHWNELKNKTNRKGPERGAVAWAQLSR